MTESRSDAQVLKGLLDALVLQVLADGDSYGFAIYQTVTTRMKEDSALFREATLYPLLHRLEAKGFVDKYWRPGERGTDRKYYRITKEGERHLKERIKNWSQVERILRRTILKDHGGTE